MVAVGEQAEYISIAEASKLLGVHRNTVRNRIKSGRYRAHKVVTPQGETYAIERESLGLPPHNTPPNGDAQDVTTGVHHNGHNPSQPAGLVSPDQQAQADAIVQRLLAPFIAELGAVREELGRVKARAEAAEAERQAAERERDELRARLDAAQAAPAATEAPTIVVVEADSHAHPPPLWRRLLRPLRGG